MSPLLRCAALSVVLLPIGCAATPPAAVRWGEAPGGDPIYLYTLANAKGMEARVTNFGAILVSLKTPDRRGAFSDIVLGFDTFDGYLNTKRYFGATVGRYANRIARGAFTLDGHAYTLVRNNGENSLHGGARGFHKVVWKGRAIAGPPPAVEFTYLSRDGEEGASYDTNFRVLSFLPPLSRLILGDFQPPQWILPALCLSSELSGGAQRRTPIIRPAACERCG